MKLAAVLFVIINFLFIPMANSDNMQMQIDRSNPSTNATPAERPQLTFSGKIKQNTCPFSFNAYFLGRIQDGQISGMAGEGTNFDWTVGTDGVFKGILPLKIDESGNQIYQSINGQLSNRNVSINIEYGTSSKPALYCISSGNNLFVGG
jgi:hypothetical protein